MKARDARKIALANQIGVKEALKIIEEEAKTGNVDIVFIGQHISEKAALELMKDYEYKISTHTDPFTGRSCYKVEW